MLSQGILLWRSFTQCLGGMGIVMLFVALLPLLGIGAARLAEVEMTGGSQGEKITARIRDTAKALWITYLGLTALEFILLRIAGLSNLDAIVVSMVPPLPVVSQPTTGVSPPLIASLSKG